MVHRVGRLVVAACILAAGAQAASGDSLAPSMPLPGAVRNADAETAAATTWPDLATSAPTQRRLVMPPTASPAPRGAPHPAAPPAIGILAILAPAFLVLLGAGIFTYILNKRLEATPQSGRPRWRRRRSLVRRYS